MKRGDGKPSTNWVVVNISFVPSAFPKAFKLSSVANDLSLNYFQIDFVTSYFVSKTIFITKIVTQEMENVL